MKWEAPKNDINKIPCTAHFLRNIVLHETNFLKRIKLQNMTKKYSALKIKTK